ncbi:MAG: FtsX-like permease family protein, partial [Acidobacteria bacterium]|nr:FtsX-like permease family protein [Acidobacteriota bacterium]
GDDVVIGDSRFTVRGIVLAEPGRTAGAFSFGSRVFVDFDDLQRAGLLSVGSRASYEIQVRLPERQVAPLARDLREQYKDRFVRVRSVQTAEDDIGRDLERTENYLSLVGLVIVVLGGVGVWSVVRVFIQQKLKTIAILKCVGATTRQILLIYIVQVTGMGLLGSALGVALAQAAVIWLKPMLVSATGVDAALTVTPSAVLQGAGIGLMVSLLFAVVPLVDIRYIRSSILLRESTAQPSRRDWVRYLTMFVVGAGVVGLAAWQAGSWRIGLTLAGGFSLVSLVLLGVGVLLVKALRPLQTSRWFSIRHAARRVGRPGSQVRPILLAVGLGAFLIVGVRLLQANLLAQFQVTARPDMPDMFLIDVQPDQVAGLRAHFAAPGSGVRQPPELIPVLRARVTGIRGRAVRLENYEDVRARGGLGREFIVTYRPRLAQNERVVDGTFWPSVPAAEAEVSIEQGLRDRQQLSIGDVIRFDILGRAVDARVTSVRSVEWADARAGGFMFVFRPGPLDNAPQTYIAPLKGPADATARARLQRDITVRYPNVSVVDVQEILATVTQVLGSVGLAISVVGSIVLFSGLLILIGSISMTKFQRVYEAAILKTLGATSRRIAAMLAVEYALLGFLAGSIGSVGALGLSWVLSRYALDVPWRAVPEVVAAGIGLSTILVAVVGILASFDVLRRRPLATLRAE